MGWASRGGEVGGGGLLVPFDRLVAKTFAASF